MSAEAAPPPAAAAAPADGAAAPEGAKEDAAAAPPKPPEPQGSEYIWKEGVPLPSLYFQPNLVDLLVPIMAKNYEEFPDFGDMPASIRGRIVEQLPLDLPLELVSHLISEEDYWKRRAGLRWRNCDIACHGNSWKQLFFERNLNDFLEDYELTKYWEEDLRDILKLSAPWVHNIDVRKLPSRMQLLILNDEMPESLTSLKIEYGNPNSCMDYEIETFGMTYSDCLSMAAVLSVTFTLTELNLSSNLLTDDKVGVLCRGMGKNPTIVNLDLSHNLISDAGCLHLAKVLDAKNCVLLFLNLCNNKIKKLGTRTLGDSISANKTLLSLNLRHNDLADYGGHRIFDYMMDNQVIQRLSMAGTGLDVESMEALSKLLHLPQSALTHLDCSANPGIGPAGGQIIYTGLVAGKRIKQIDVKKCNIGAELETKIEQLLLARSFDEEDMILNPQG